MRETHDRRTMFRAPQAVRFAGLTLVEMLIVMAICGMLAALLVPMALRSRANARTAVCANNLRGLGEAYALCLTQSGNYFPDAYYTFDGTEGTYQVGLKNPESAQPDVLFDYGYSPTLTCPCDDRPAEVLGRTPMGNAVKVRTSYAYNVALPLMFRNASRVGQPVNTVTFYDGDPTAVVGEWQHSLGWAENTVQKRHKGYANYLFLDGHVERSGNFPEAGFSGGSRWLASSHSSDGEDDPNPGDRAGAAITGKINIDPNNSPHMEFILTLPGGYDVTRGDLHSDDPHDHAGFHPDYLEYTGPAVSIRVKPAGHGNQNDLTVDGVPYALENKYLYIITSYSMNVHLYNDGRDENGNAMGDWWITLDTTDATITVIK